MPKKVEEKKVDKKKQGVTGTKQFEETQLIQEEQQKVSEKEYEKKFNQVFILLDYPSTGQEVLALKEAGGGLDAVIKISEKLVGDYEGVLEEK